VNSKGSNAHKIALGGRVVVETFFPYGAGLQKTIVATVPVEKIVKVKPIVLKKFYNFKEYGNVEMAVVDYDTVLANIKTMQESYAQCGIKIVYSQPEIIDPRDISQELGFASWANWRIFYYYDGVLESNGLPRQPNNLTSMEKDLFSFIRTGRSGKKICQDDEIALIYVENFSGNRFNGLAYIEQLVKAGGYSDYKTYANNIVMAANVRKFTAPHELLHILLDAVHYPEPDDYAWENRHPRMLWYIQRQGIGIRDSSPDDTGSFLSRKRITKNNHNANKPTQDSQSARAKKSPFAKNPSP